MRKEQIVEKLREIGLVPVLRGATDELSARLGAHGTPMGAGS